MTNVGAENKKNSKALLIGFLAMCLAVSSILRNLFPVEPLGSPDFCSQALGNSIFRVLQLQPLRRYALFSNLAST